MFTNKVSDLRASFPARCNPPMGASLHSAGLGNSGSPRRRAWGGDAGKSRFSISWAPGGGGQFRVVEDLDEPRSIGLFGHHPVHEALPMRHRSAIGKNHPCHPPIDVNDGQAVSEKSYASDLTRHVARREHARVRLSARGLDRGSAVNMVPEDVRDICIVGVKQGVGVRVVPVP